jgi:hypothetical protein
MADDTTTEKEDKMRKLSTLAQLTLLVAAAAGPSLAQGVQPSIDNERITVWDTTSPLPPAEHDFVAVSSSGKRSAVFGRKGDIPGVAGERTVVIELKDHPVASIPNNSGYPLAFPRARAKKLLENDRIIVWSYSWNLNEPTPMHFHDKDIVVVFEEDTALKSTTPDGKSVVSENKSGDIRFNRRERIHSELLVRGTGSAVVTELK